ncbi:hypothetical protein FQN54_002642 [Arachnomyces sp. PD_36]|nr:hypothetical protein FQN54_002642 [Arachnomyces sp. PD_36]
MSTTRSIKSFTFAATVIAILFITMGECSRPSYIEYSTVPGYFLQDDPATDPESFDYVATGFGLINQTYDADATFDPRGEKTQWERFEHQVRSLNEGCDHDTQYKVLYMGRHGEGHHNVAEEFYGTEAWDCYWSLLDGNGTATWDDAHLTEEGRAQAMVANGAWRTQIERKVPLPESYYTSPLHRCLTTGQITFTGLPLPESQPFVPLVKEVCNSHKNPLKTAEEETNRRNTQLLRETLGIHTCDRRSTRSAIHHEFPSFPIEPNFTEDDELWDPKLRESDSARTARLRQFLDDVFSHDDNQFISFTAHSGAITSILEAVKHREFKLNTGAMIPVLVKAERVYGQPPPTVIDPPTTAPTCSVDPTATPN